MSDQILQLLRAADPARANEVDESNFDSQLTAILSSDPSAHADENDLAPIRTPSWRGRRVVAGLAAGAIGLAIWFGVSIGSPGGTSDSAAYAAALIRVAEANPRLVITAPGWQITRADEFGRAYGQLTISSGNDELELRWAPAADYRPTYRDRAQDGSRLDVLDLAVGRATIFDAGGSEYTAMIAPSNGTYVEIRSLSDLGGLGNFVSLIESVQATDVGGWLSALPERTVTEENRAAVVDEMLGDTPLPQGFNVDALANSAGLIIDRDQLRYKLASSVACAWIDVWKGRGVADAPGSADHARTILDEASSWAVMSGLYRGGATNILDWTEDGLAGSGYGPNTDPGYRHGLGCDD